MKLHYNLIFCCRKFNFVLMNTRVMMNSDFVHLNFISQELYQISATGETDNLKAMLIKLQEENKKLRMEVEVSVNTQPGESF